MSVKKQTIRQTSNSKTRKRYRLLQSGETTDPRQGDQFNTNRGWVPTVRDGRLIHDGLVGAYRRPI